MFEILAIAAAIFGGASAITSSNAAKSQRKAQNEQRNQQNMRAAMERRQSIRQMRMAYAAAEQNAENQGVADGSSRGGRGSIITQGNVNLSFLDDNMLSANKQGGFLDQASKQSAQAGMWGALSSLAMTGAGMVPGATPPTATIPGTPSGTNPFVKLGNNVANRNIALNMTGYRF